MKFKRIFLLVLDSLGVGETIDAEDYNDKGVPDRDSTPGNRKIGEVWIQGIKKN